MSDQTSTVARDVPPPPPIAPADADESTPRPRTTAATWVAGVGAGLLLAAAATFLAVSWETLAPAGRVAVISAVTGAAVLGGLRLRQSLPAVGAVLFHLGALLIPLDVLGLTIQADASSATRWFAAGVAALLVLPPLAVVGRSRVLGAAAVAGLPVAATGLGLGGTGSGAGSVLTPAAVTALGALVAVAFGRLTAADPQSSQGAGTTVTEAVGVLRADLARWAAGVALAAVTVPLVAVGIRAWGDGVASATTAAVSAWAGLSTVSGAVTTVAAVIAVALGVRKTARPIAMATVGATAMLGLVGTALPAAMAAATRPGAEWFVAAVVVVVLAELGALWLRDGRWRRAARAVVLVEVAAVPVAVLSLVPLVGLSGASSAPAVAGVALATAAGAWAIAAVRTTVVRPALVAAAGVQLATAAAAADGPILAVVGILLASVGATTAWMRPSDTGLASPTGVRTAGVAAAAALLTALLTAVVVTVGPIATHNGPAVAGALRVVTLGAVVAITLWAIHLLRPVGRRVATGIAALGAVVQTVITVMTAVSDASSGWVVVTGLALGWLATAAWLGDDLLAPALRIGAAVVGMLALWPLPAVGADVNDGALLALGDPLMAWLDPRGLGPAIVVGAWLVADGLTRRSKQLAPALAGVLAVRVVAATTFGLTESEPATGVVLAVIALGAGVAAVVWTPRWRAAAVTAAVTATLVTEALTRDLGVARASVLVAVGIGIVAVGVLRHQAAVALAGVGVATFGWWWLLGLWRADALDAWVAPVALGLAVAGTFARQRDPQVSSWAAEFPPVAILGLACLLERATGGGGVHAVAAGAVAVAAIAAGGARRLLGPLAGGTVLAVAVVAVETLAVVAAVPTWAWLTLGGVVLLAVAVLIERTGGNPTRLVLTATRSVTGRYR